MRFAMRMASLGVVDSLEQNSKSVSCESCSQLIIGRGRLPRAGNRICGRQRRVEAVRNFNENPIRNCRAEIGVEVFEVIDVD